MGVCAILDSFENNSRAQVNGEIWLVFLIAVVCDAPRVKNPGAQTSSVGERTLLNVPVTFILMMFSFSLAWGYGIEVPAGSVR
jgi:hypothetical protein